MRADDERDKPSSRTAADTQRRRARHLRPEGCRRTLLPLLFLLAHERRIESGETPVPLSARPRPWLN